MTAWGDKQLNVALQEKIQQLERDLQTFAEERDRARGVRVKGVQHDHEGRRHFILANDDAGETGSCFELKPGETIGEALDRLDATWQASIERQGVPHAR